MEKLKVTNYEKKFIISLPCSKFVDEALIFRFPFLHKDSTGSLKFRLLFILIPKSIRSYSGPHFPAFGLKLSIF